MVHQKTGLFNVGVSVILLTVKLHIWQEIMRWTESGHRAGWIQTCISHMSTKTQAVWIICANLCTTNQAGSEWRCDLLKPPRRLPSHRIYLCNYGNMLHCLLRFEAVPCIGFPWLHTLSTNQSAQIPVCDTLLLDGGLSLLHFTTTVIWSQSCTFKWLWTTHICLQTH